MCDFLCLFLPLHITAVHICSNKALLSVPGTNREVKIDAHEQTVARFSQDERHAEATHCAEQRQRLCAVHVCYWIGK